MNKNIPKINIDEIVYLVTAIIVIIFMINDFIIINISILSLVLIILMIKNKGRIILPKTLIIILAFIGLLFIQLILNPSEYFNIDQAMKEISRFLIYALIILLVSNISVRSQFLVKTWIYLFWVIFVIAVFQYYKLFGMNNVLLEFYGNSVYFDIAEKYSGLANFRAGSVFVNPNSYAKYILVFLALYLSTCLIIIQKKYVLWMLLAGIIISLILAGSRTGFLISIIMFTYYILLITYKNRSKINLKFLIIFPILITSLISYFLSVGRDKLDLENIRFIQVEAGLGNSLEYKFKTFLYILQDFDVINIIIGLGTFEGTWGLTTVDFDIGYLIVFYGLIGCILYIFMLVDIYNYRKKYESSYYLLNRYLIIVFIFFGLTGGLFFNLRIFSILSLLFFVKIIDDSNSLSPLSRNAE